MKIGFVGAGSMATALARGLGDAALVADPDAGRAEALAAAVGGSVAASNAELAREADLTILCHKPAHLEAVAQEVAGEASAVASIVAATPLDRLGELYPDTPVYRFIPNIPVEIGRGVICFAGATNGADGPEREVLELFGRCGAVIAVEERLIDPAMALMSCGPAFLALVVEALARAGTAHGIEAGLATRLVVETMAGSAAYLDANGLDPAELRRRVATPGGLTEKGLHGLETAGVPKAFAEVVDLVVEASAA
jgi:pyrroline-5-carboxylate reductase